MPWSAGSRELVKPKFHPRFPPAPETRPAITNLERRGALTHLVNEAPASVVAKATGNTLGTTAARAVITGADWSRYAALKPDSR